MNGSKTASTGASPNEQACVTQNEQCSKCPPGCESEFPGESDSFPNRAAGRFFNPSAVHTSSHCAVGIVCPNTARVTGGASEATRTAKIATQTNSCCNFLLLPIAPIGQAFYCLARRSDKSMAEIISSAIKIRHLPPLGGREGFIRVFHNKFARLRVLLSRPFLHLYFVNTRRYLKN